MVLFTWGEDVSKRLPRFIRNEGQRMSQMMAVGKGSTPSPDPLVAVSYTLLESEEDI